MMQNNSLVTTSAYTRKDFGLSVLSGAITGLIVYLMLLYGGSGQVWETYSWALIIIVPAVFVFGTWLGTMLANWFAFFRSFSRYAAVGFLNTAVDFGALAVLIYLFKYSDGETTKLIIANTGSFLIAVTNSYFWNKLWSFESRGGGAGQFAQYVAITVIGLLLNDAIIYIGVSYVQPMFGISPENWIFVTKAVGTVVSLIWNFVGYRFVVFKASARN